MQSIKSYMDATNIHQRNALPHLQSLIIVLIKAILTHVTALVTQSSGANGLQSGFQYQDNQNGAAGRDMNGINGHSNTPATNEELDAMRTQEVMDKAVTGTLMLILKWFKVSRKPANLFGEIETDIPSRHTQVRVYYSAACGFQLYSVDTEAAATARN